MMAQILLHEVIVDERPGLRHSSGVELKPRQAAMACMNMSHDIILLVLSAVLE